MDIQIAQILFQIFNFSVIFAALYFLLNKPISKVLEDRAKKIAETEKTAEKIAQEKETIEEEKKKILAKTRKEAQKILLEESETAKETAQNIIAEAKKKAVEEIENLKNDFEKEKEKMMKELKNDFVDAVINTSQQVIQESLTKKDHLKTIETEFKNFVKTNK